MGVTIIPFDPDKASFKEPATKLPIAYPDGRNPAYRDIPNKFDQTAFNEHVGNPGFFVIEGTRFHLAIAVDGALENSDNKTVRCIQEMISSMIADKLGIIAQTGYINARKIHKITHSRVKNMLRFLQKIFDLKHLYSNNRGQLKLALEFEKMNLGELYGIASGLRVVEELGWTQMRLPYEKVEEFEAKLNENREEYKENRGQLKMALRLGKMNLGDLFSLASGLGLVKDLWWTQIDVPYNQVEKFEMELQGNRENYKGNSGQLKMALRLGKINIGQLYSLASGLEEVEKLGWTKMNVPYRKVEEFETKLKGNSDKYLGNRGQIQMSITLGKMHLSNLYSLASGLGFVEELSWTKIDVPYEKVEEFEIRLRENSEMYKGNRGQLKMALELGKMNLGHLYSLATGLGLVEDLLWTKMSVSYKEMMAFEMKLKENRELYEGNQGQLKMGLELRKMHLGQLYSLASGLGLAEELGWNCMNVPYEWIEEFEIKLRENREIYKGNRGQLKVALELEKMHLGNLYSLASGLGVAEELSWTCMNVPYASVEEFEIVLRKNREMYKGNPGQLKMALELGKMNIGNLYSLASGLGLAEELGWNCVNVPYEWIEEFEIKLRENREMYKGNRGQLEMSLELGKINLGNLYSLASGLGVAEELGWTCMNVPYARVEEFEMKLRKNREMYKGNPGQLKMALELEKMNLGNLYSLASGLDVVKELGWTGMHGPYDKIEALLNSQALVKTSPTTL